MALSAQERTRYARHLLLPEVGLAGQELLLATHVAIAPDADVGAAAVARTYLSRAGMHLEEGALSGERHPGTGASAVAELRGRDVRVFLPSQEDIARIAGHRPELAIAAQALTGALAAVEAIKVALTLGQPSTALTEVRLLPEDV